MILKTKDDSRPLVAQLDGLLKLKLTDRQRRDLAQQRSQIVAGAKAEAQAAYLIDFHLKDSSSWAVIHNLRLEHNSRVAQIDHLLIWQGLEVYVVESKGFRTKIRITGDQWEVLRYGHWAGVPSPVAQNERHILVLKDLIAGSQWAPRYFNMIKQPIRYINVVAVPPECGICGRDSGVMVVSMDNLIKRIRADWSGFFSPSLFSDITAAQLRQLGRSLVACHRPARFDFAKRFGVKPGQPIARPTVLPWAQSCGRCGGPLTRAEARYCEVKPDRFLGQKLCRKCQLLVPNSGNKLRERSTGAPAATGSAG
jgi:hypothetical protein